MYKKIVKSYNNKKNTEKILKYYFILNKWLDIRQNGMSLSWYFHKNGYKKIGIYGAKELGKRLWYEFKGKDYTVYMIDKRAENFYDEYEVYNPDEGVLQEIDILVVTASFYYKQIKKEMKNRFTCPIIPIEEVVDDLLSGNYPMPVMDIEEAKILKR